MDSTEDAPFPARPFAPSASTAPLQRSRGALWLAALIALLALVGGAAWYKLMRDVPQAEFAGPSYDRADYFKYGSIGTEAEAGIPYWIFHVLPKVFPEHLPGPGGYASLGMGWEPGRPLPVGFSMKTIGFERVGINCAACHSATVQVGPGAPQVFAAGPAHSFNALAYQRFLFACASDPRFTAERILREIAQVYELPWIDRLLYRALVPLTRKALLEQKQQFEWTAHKPLWGRGRIDPFNPVKVAVLQLDPGETIGNADMVPIWNLRPREGMSYHWDGLNDDIDEVIESSAIGDGATPSSLPRERLQEMKAWLMDLRPPPYPWLQDVNPEQRARGEALFARDCAHCHGDHSFREGRFVRREGWRVGEVEPIASVGTDAHRIGMWSQQAADAYNSYGQRYGLEFSHFRAPNGYVNVPLDAIWIRAPYLHNGSVPTLRDLLEPPERRPRVFYRGSIEYDRQRMGFVSSGEQVERVGTRFDVTEAGNGNQGHLWGTELDADEKDALVEYLKTF